MSDPIRRAGGPGPVGGAAGPQDVGLADDAKEAFRATLDATRAATAVAPAPQLGALDPVAIAAGLRAGSLDPSGAVEALVQRALASPAARALGDAGRAELERSLRAALEHDPTLSAMVADLGRR
ncbi:MAG: hypothetical protein OHK0013_32900 [Sandaracinaceae bacterium]